MPRVNNGPSTKVGVIWQNSDLWAKNWNFGLKKKKSLLYSNHVMATTEKNCTRKKVAYAQIGAIWEVSPKHPRDPFLDFGLIYYIVCVFLSATFSHFMDWTYMLKLPRWRFLVESIPLIINHQTRIREDIIELNQTIDLEPCCQNISSISRTSLTCKMLETSWRVHTSASRHVAYQKVRFLCCCC